jgi:GNAT superfamily N-acetyltransferase
VREPHLRDVGVLPEAQGKGLGRALMAPTLECCNRDGLPAYLETSSERSAAERQMMQLAGIAGIFSLALGAARVLVAQMWNFPGRGATPDHRG